jgi:hypothetical protein
MAIAATGIFKPSIRLKYKTIICTRLTNYNICTEPIWNHSNYAHVHVDGGNVVLKVIEHEIESIVKEAFIKVRRMPSVRGCFLE